jgi:hypothetical protein
MRDCPANQVEDAVGVWLWVRDAATVYRIPFQSLTKWSHRPCPWIDRIVTSKDIASKTKPRLYLLKRDLDEIHAALRTNKHKPPADQIAFPEIEQRWPMSRLQWNNLAAKRHECLGNRAVRRCGSRNLPGPRGAFRQTATWVRADVETLMHDVARPRDEILTDAEATEQFDLTIHDLANGVRHGTRLLGGKKFTRRAKLARTSDGRRYRLRRAWLRSELARAESAKKTMPAKGNGAAKLQTINGAKWMPIQLAQTQYKTGRQSLFHLVETGKVRAKRIRLADVWGPFKEVLFLSQGDLDKWQNKRREGARPLAAECARKLLERMLPAFGQDICHEAARAGIGQRSLRKAQMQLGVLATQTGFQGRSYWHLPGQPIPTVRADCHARDEAMAFLKGLSDWRSRPQAELARLAAARGIAKTTLRRAIGEWGKTPADDGRQSRTGPSTSPKLTIASAAQTTKKRGGRPASSHTARLYKRCFELHQGTNWTLARIRRELENEFGGRGPKEDSHVTLFAQRYADLTPGVVFRPREKTL